MLARSLRRIVGTGFTALALATAAAVFVAAGALYAPEQSGFDHFRVD